MVPVTFSPEDDRFDSLIEHYWDVAVETIDPTPADWRLVKCQIRQESNFNPQARNHVSGAMGLMQLMPSTARSLGVSNAYDPEQNISAGIRHLVGICYRIFADEQGIERWKFALGAYNAGQRNIISAQNIARARYLETYRWVSIVQTLPRVTGDKAKETTEYVARIMTCFHACKGEVA